MTTGARQHSGLVRGLGVWAASAVVVGAMIGQAIFLVPSQMARSVGSASQVLAVWIAGGIVVLFGAFCYAELGAALPQAGGDYVYLSRGLGPVWGFLSGWTGCTLTRPATVATIATGFSRFAGFLLPFLANPIFAWKLSLPVLSRPLTIGLNSEQLLAAAAVVTVAAINYFGVRTAGQIQVVLTALKVSAVLVVIGIGLSLGKVSLSAVTFSSGSSYVTLGAYLTALVPVMTAYNGFQYAGVVGEEIVNPEKDIPRATILGGAAVIGLYVLANLAYFHTLSFAEVAQSQHVASDVVARVAGTNGAKWLTIGMMVSALGAVHIGFLTGPRLLFAMGRDGWFFAFAKRLQPKYHTPSGALLFQSATTILLLLTGGFEDLYSLSMFAVWGFFVLTVFALFRLRIREPELARPYRVWGYPWTPLIFAGVAIAMSGNILWVRPVRSLLGLGVILLGLPFFRHWRRQAAAVAGGAV
jgi:APA family basic amino acid/polyamine antiporter